MAIVEETMLIKVSASANNNKFYHVVLHDNGEVVKRWGRVGSQGTSSTEWSDRTGYDRAISQKQQRGYEKTQMLATSIPESVDNHELAKVAKSTLMTQETAELSSLVDTLVKNNRHDIIKKSGGQITVNAEGILSTPLGLVNKDSLLEARQLLETISPQNPRIESIERYLKLVPQKVPFQRGWHLDFFTKTTTVEKQQDFLKQLQESLEWYEEEKEAKLAESSQGDIDYKAMYQDLFNFTIDVVPDDAPAYGQVVDMYQKTINKRHGSTGRYQVKRVFSLNAQSDAIDRFNQTKETIGNNRLLWHGTRAFNILSILRRGLIVPPMTGGSYVTTGRMFGDGVYFSDQSTKSLNYSIGRAPGMMSTVQTDSTFMFVADVALGWEFRPHAEGFTYFTNEALQKAHAGRGRKGRPFTSINVKGGTCGVMNNEIIVWNTDQINLKYLVEFS